MWKSGSWPAMTLASASARLSMPWSVLMWYLTQNFSPPALYHMNVWLEKPSMCRQLDGMPRSVIRIDHLVRRLRRQGPEVPLHVVVAQVRVGAALLGVDEVLELLRVAHEEHRGVVADQVVVALLGVELDGEAARVADRVGAAELARHGREADDQAGVLALGEQVRLGVLADVLGRFEHAVGPAALGVHHPLGHALPVELGHLLDQVVVLEEERAVRPDGLGEFVARRRDAGVSGGHRALIGHGGSPPVRCVRTLHLAHPTRRARFAPAGKIGGARGRVRTRCAWIPLHRPPGR